MKTFIRLDGTRVTAIVSASRQPEGYVEVDESRMPSDLASDFLSYEYDGQEFRHVEQTEEDRVALLANQVRQRRDRLLQASDWTQVPDAPVDRAAWADYRQALRDLSKQKGFPDQVVWPVPPA
jgi:hypothetical protein